MFILAIIIICHLRMYNKVQSLLYILYCTFIVLNNANLNVLDPDSF